MSTEAQKRTVSRWVLEMWGGGNLALVDELAFADYVYRAPGMDPVRGANGLKELVRFYRTAFPDLSNSIEEQVAEGNTVVTRGTTRGTHEGPLGDIAASGKRIAVPWVMITRLEGQKIAEEWEFYDALDFMKQIGAMPGNTH
ncbi:MAG TPA: ester cyclase [Gemmatimonadales bacterium]|nr:ester cyclase [Gemmatimonadales bacterium]